QVLVTDPLSVFNEDNVIIFNNSTLNNKWSFPDPEYKDAYGNPSMIPVSLNSQDIYEPFGSCRSQLHQGQTPDNSTFLWIRPQDLEFVADFFDAWDPAWAKSLVKYHPERCYLDYSEALCNQKASSISTDMLSSDEFDGLLLSINSYQDANNLGLI